MGAAATFAALFLGVAPVGANGGGGPAPFQCNKTVNGGTIAGSVQVPANGVCVLNGVSVSGSVYVDANAYFESNGSIISGQVVGNQALTLYLYNHSAVAGSVAGYQTAQLFLYESAVSLNVGAANGVTPGYGHFQICGSQIANNVTVYQIGPDVLIGAPAAGCRGNAIDKGDVTVDSNSADTEVYVIGNSINSGNLAVTNNAGAGDKQVTGNTVGKGDITCSGNSAPFSASNNVTRQGTVSC